MVLDECGQCRGITELLFQDQFKLHLTITCFVLCNAAEIKRAIKLMEQCENTIIKYRIKIICLTYICNICIKIY